METLLTAEEVLNIAEEVADRASTPYMRKHSAVIGAIYIDEIADFRHAVRSATDGAVLHIQGCMAQFDHYPCIGRLSDGTPVFKAEVHPGIDPDEWSSIVD